jgi:hypothetical protein
VIVFISSVRRGLEDERDYLPGLLKAAGHEPQRFEDFSAQPVPSRDACLTGVEGAEVYLLLLGQHYGEPLTDTGKAPTEEEFTVAKRRGIPILVFRKVGGAVDARQQEFITRVGSYQQGRFWKEFRDTSALAVAVLDALRAVANQGAPLRWEAVDTLPAVRWRSDRLVLADHAQGYIPVLEAHLASVVGRPVLTVGVLEPLASQLGRAGRDVGLFAQAARVDLGSDASSAWATSLGETARRGWNQVRRDGPAGVAVDRDGSIIVFKPLARDTLGTLVNQASLTADLEPMLRLGHDMLPADVSELAPAAGLGPITQVMEGDPADVGRRSSSGMRMSAETPVRTTADSKVAAAALPAAIPEIARELAARILAELRTRR